MIQDKEIFNEIYNIYTELCKFYLEDLYGEPIEKPLSLMEYIKQISKPDTGHIKYENYLYSDTYDKYDSKNVHVNNGKYYVNSSLDDVIQKYAIKELASWPEIVKWMGRWYEENIHTYQGNGSGNMMHNFGMENGIISNVRDDCTGFITSCVLLYISFNIDVQIKIANNKRLENIIVQMNNFPPGSALWDSVYNKDNIETQKIKELMLTIGFEELKYDPNKIQPFDIIVGNSGGEFHHGEIYAGYTMGNHYSWSWGNIHDKSHGGMPAKSVSIDKPNCYNTIWRIKGLKRITSSKELGFS